MFGETIAAEDGRATVDVGSGVHPFRDPALTDEFDAPRRPIDVSEFHVYAADWRPGRVDFLIDGEHVKTVERRGLSDAADGRRLRLPDRADDAPPDHVPELVVEEVRGRGLGRA